MAKIFGYPRFRALLQGGTPAVGYKLYSYLAGTATPTPTYTSQDQSAQNPNPTVLDGAGEAAIWLAPNIAYKLVLRTDTDTDVWTLDNIQTPEGGYFSTLSATGAASFATISASGQITSTVAIGTAPLVITSTTKVANLNADLLDGKDWAAPDPIGATTPSSGKFTTLEASGDVTKKADDKQQTANGAELKTGQISEEITLSTVGTTSDSVADLLPANSIILAVVARVTTAITVATSWALGDATTSARFLTATTDMTLGTTKVGTNQMKGSVATDAAGPTQASAAKLRVTTVGTPTAGKIRVTVYYLGLTPPTS